MLSINSVGKAVVFASGAVSCITQSKYAVKSALAAATYQGHVGVSVKDVVLVQVGDKRKLEWVVVTDKFPDLVFGTRKEARCICHYDRANGSASHIERREYVLVDSKRVS